MSGALFLTQFPKLSPDDYSAIGEDDFAANLGLQVPPSRLNGRINELHANVALAEFTLIHGRGKYK